MVEFREAVYLMNNSFKTKTEQNNTQKQIQKKIYNVYVE